MLVLALHGFVCVAGFMAMRALPEQTKYKRGVDRWVHEHAGPFAMVWVSGRDDLLDHHADLDPRHDRSPTCRSRSGISQGTLLLTVLPHALLELTAVFLPLAAFLIASRQGDWHELLAATVVTVSVAIPMLIVAAFVEAYLWPEILGSVILRSRRAARDALRLPCARARHRPEDHRPRPAGRDHLDQRRARVDRHLLRDGPRAGRVLGLRAVNSLRTLPYMEEWHRRYSSAGATVIGDPQPRLHLRQADEQIVRAAVKRLGVERPVLLDPAFIAWRDYGNKGWPARYLWSKGGELRTSTTAKATTKTAS